MSMSSSLSNATNHFSSISVCISTLPILVSSTVRDSLVVHVGHKCLSVSICEEFRCAAEDTTMPREAPMKPVRNRAVAVKNSKNVLPQLRIVEGVCGGAVHVDGSSNFSVSCAQIQNIESPELPRTMWAKQEVLLHSASKRFALWRYAGVLCLAYTELPQNCVAGAGRSCSTSRCQANFALWWIVSSNLQSSQ